MTPETIFAALLGGSLIGLAAGLLLKLHNRVAGISGIASGILPPWDQECGWRFWFLSGLICSGLLYQFSIGAMPFELHIPNYQLLIAGVLVGYGSRLGGGCTSGHGVCGIARLSIRSLIATATFMLTGGISVFLIRHVF